MHIITITEKKKPRKGRRVDRGTWKSLEREKRRDRQRQQWESRKLSQQGGNHKVDIPSRMTKSGSDAVIMTVLFQ